MKKIAKVGQEPGQVFESRRVVVDHGPGHPLPILVEQVQLTGGIEDFKLDLPGISDQTDR
ncbi:hypothetical protein [Oceanicola sp. S124]|uniref:hypothetical protein n=1 Tax=Oceanicola sp. S124 TaxID=1042378 RepID=UPI0002DF6E69|nr:hypothetical protein [Oceanicola sp. S124]